MSVLLSSVQRKLISLLWIPSNDDVTVHAYCTILDHQTYCGVHVIWCMCILFYRTQEIIKDASPEDYNNEELYQVMEKFYFVVSFTDALMSCNNLIGFSIHALKDVEKTKSLDAFEADRSIIELKEEIGHGEFGRYELM